MAQAVYEWVKNLIYYLIFLSLINNLLARSSYEKYVRFFAGLVFILLVISPLTKSLHLEQEIAGQFMRFSLEAQSGELEKQLLGMEKKRQEEVEKCLVQTAQEEIMQMAKEEGIACRKVEATWKEDASLGIDSVLLVLEKKGKTEEKKKESQSDGRQVSVKVENIVPVQIGERKTESVSAEEMSAGADKVSQKEWDRFIGKVEGYYGLETSDIRIQWENE